MKQYILIIIFSLPGIIFSQPCLPDGIDFNTQTQIDSFQTNYPSCTEIEGNVVIAYGNDITNLDGLNCITSIGGNFLITNCHRLTELNGLNSLTSIGGYFQIYENDSLKHLSGLNSLTSISGSLNIGENKSLSNLSGLESLVSLGRFLYLNNNNSLSDISALTGLTYISEYLAVEHNSSLSSLDGLNNIDSIGVSLLISGNYSLGNLSGLDKLIKIGTNSIGGVLELSQTKITSLNALSNLTSINNGLIKLFGNYELLSLEGLENISPSSIHKVDITYNNSLSICDIQSICNFLLNSSNGEICYNANGCNSITEVTDACANGINENKRKHKISIYPNPAADLINVNSDGLEIESVNIYNQIGQKVICTCSINKRIDISSLGNGIYIIEFISNKILIKEKLLVNK